MENLLFLKLGGSLITDKTRPRTVRPKMLAGLCAEIATVRAHDPNLLLLLGHGSGSFGHVAAKKHATREGLPPPSQPSPRAASPNGGKGERGKFSARRGELEASYWRGFTEVWHEAAELNKLVMDALRERDRAGGGGHLLGFDTAQAGYVARYYARCLWGCGI